MIWLEIIFTPISSGDLKDGWNKCKINYFMKIYHTTTVASKNLALKPKSDFSDFLKNPLETINSLIALVEILSYHICYEFSLSLKPENWVTI